MYYVTFIVKYNTNIYYYEFRKKNEAYRFITCLQLCGCKSNKDTIYYKFRIKDNIKNHYRKVADGNISMIRKWAKRGYI